MPELLAGGSSGVEFGLSAAEHVQATDCHDADRATRVYGDRMTRLQIELPVQNEAPTIAELTDYDRAHFVTYLRLLDAEEAQASPEEVMRRVLGIDPKKERARARRAYDTHLARAHWMTKVGYHHILRDSKLR